MRARRRPCSRSCAGSTVRQIGVRDVDAPFDAVTASCNAGARSASATAPTTSMPSGNAAVSGAGSASRSTVFGEHEVDVLRVALVPGRQRQPEAHLRPGREALGERERELRDAKRALERPGDVAVADPADLAELRVLEPDRVRGAAPHDGTGAGRRRAPWCRGSAPGRRRPTRSGPGPCPAIRPRAPAATPPRARGRSRCTPRSRSTESTGNRGARARPGRPASRPRGSRRADRPRCAPRAAPRRGCGAG